VDGHPSKNRDLPIEKCRCWMIGIPGIIPNGRKFQVFSRWIIVIQPVHENNNDDGNDNKS
jgi:hypothetical protein